MASPSEALEAVRRYLTTEKQRLLESIARRQDIADYHFNCGKIAQLKALEEEITVQLKKGDETNG